MDRNIADKREILELVKQKRLTSEEALRLLKDNAQYSNGAVTEKTVEERSEIVMYSSSWKEAELAGDRKSEGLQGNIVVFDTDGSFFVPYKTHMEGMEGHKGQISVVKPGEGFANHGEGHYEINPQNAEEYNLLLKSLGEENRYPQAIIHFWSREGWENGGMLEELLDRGIYSLFYLSQALMSNKSKPEVRLAYVYTTREKDITPQYSAVGAFIKTVILENPKFLWKAVAIDEEGLDYRTLPKILMDELDAPAQEDIELYWKQNTRYAKRLEDYNGTRAEVLSIKQDGVYLITGGLGGLGYLFALYLASKAAVKLVLTGRSEPDEESMQKIRELEALGAEAIYIKSDVTSRESVESLINQAREKYGYIHGVIHSAGVYRNGFIIKKTREDFQEVLAPKVYGTVYLDEALKEEELDFFALFSSTSAVSGKVGQSDYSYANSYLDSFALQRNKRVEAGIRKGRTVSINWPFWEKEGMAREITPEERRMYAEKAGIEGLPSGEGIKAFEDAVLKGGSSSCVVFYGYKNRIRDYLDSVISNSGKRDGEENGSVDTGVLYQKTQELVKEMISNEIGTPAASIDPSISFEEFGIDSIIINHFNAEMEKKISSVSKTLLFEYPNINDLAAHLVKAHEQELVRLFGLDRKPVKPEVQVNKPVKPAAVSVRKDAVKSTLPPQREKAGHQELPQEDIAIIGISGRYPKANNLDELWENLKLGKNCVTEVPLDRWDHSEYFDPDHENVKPGKTYCKWGGFIDDVDKFDPLFFNISPREAEYMDPQERVFLQIAWEAMEDAGYTREQLREATNGEKGANVGVFVGTTTYQYELLGIEEWGKGNMVTPISHPWSISNRVSYTFNFNGPSIPVDTACSSSLSALHYACESLKKGECGMAIAGGVHMYLHPYKYVSMAQMGMFSPTGSCRTFSSSADGFVPGEGAGALLLKPLQKAVAEGDHIYAVIKGTSVNHGGKTNGYTVPNPNAQASLIQETLRKSGVDPRLIGYIEAHGTGTKLGDPVEITGLTKAFREYNKDRQYCAVGSIKSNIGHAESAAGISGLTKILLQMKYKQLVPSIHCEELNENINFQETPFYVQRELAEWKNPSITENGIKKTYPRYAGISGFGAGGSNAHAILMEYDETLSKSIQEDRPQIVLLSARSEERLHEYAARFVDFLEKKAVVSELPSLMESVVGGTKEEIEALKPISDHEIAHYMDNLKALEKFQVVLLAHAFRRMGVFQAKGETHGKVGLKEKLKVISLYDRLFDALMDILQRYGFITVKGDAIEVTSLIENKETLSIFEDVEKAKRDFDEKHPSIHSYTKLLTTCIDAYPEVLTGERSHMDVMFPDGSIELVEGIYKGNKIIDYYNKLVAAGVKQYVKQRLAADPGALISILEVGSGTGGTSVFALEELKEYAASIKYYYTDISNGLVQYGKKAYGKYGFAEFKVLDIEKSPEIQGFKPQSIDVVFATNVLHATRNMGKTLANIGDVLKTNGLIAINEFTVLGDFSTLTYGFTKGWWLFEDGESRIKWSPLLSIEGWKGCLTKNGFGKTAVVGILGRYADQSAQNVIFAEYAGGTSRQSSKGRSFNINLKDLAYTLQVGREHQEERLALLVSSPEELVEKLKTFLQKQPAIQGLFRGNAKSDKNKPELLVKGRAGKEFLNILFSDGEYPYIAQLWASGIEMDWKLLYTGEEKNQRISLPTYPFAKNRYWIEQADRKPLPAANTPTRVLHPLVDDNRSTLYDCRFAKTFTGHEFYIKDHKNVLPGVAYLEMVRAAGQLADGNRHVGKIKNFVWMHPIGFDGNPKEVCTDFYPSDDGIEFEVSTTNAADGQRTVNAGGKLCYGEGDGFEDERMDIKSIISRCGNGNDRAGAYYGRMEALRNAAGPRFRGLTEFYCNEEEGLSRLRVLPEFNDSIREYLLHPTLTDGAFQTVNAFAWSVLQGSDPIYVPFAMEEMEIAEGPFTAAYAYVCKAEHFDETGIDTVACHLSILDENGRIVVRIKGLNFRQIPRSYMDMLEANPPKYTGISYRSLWEAGEIEEEGSGPAIGNTLIFDDTEGLRNALQEIEPTGRKVLVKPGKKFKKLNATLYEVHPSREEDYGQLFEELDREGFASQNVIHAWSMGSFTREKDETGQQLDRGLYSVFSVCKSLMCRKNKGKIGIIYAYGCRKASIPPAFAALGSFARSLGLEDSNLAMRTLGIDVGAKDWEEYKSSILPGILKKELGVGNEYEVRYENDKRLTKNMRGFDIGREAIHPPRIKHGGVYVITGGTGGLGLVFTEYLSKKYKAKLVLCGRSEPSAETRSKLDSFEKHGSKILFIKADISKADGARELVDRAKTEFGKIDGVIHSAGIVRDSLLVRKTRAELDAVLEAKVYGTINLDHALREMRPDFFVLFSSTASILGNLGQCDYAYANGFMDHYAEMLASEGAYEKVLAINWGLWKHGGMRPGEQNEKFLWEAAGIKAMESEIGLEMFEKGLSLPVHGFTALEGDPLKLQKIPAFAGKPVREVKKIPEKNAASPESSGVKGESGAVTNSFKKDMTALVSSILKIPIQDIHPHDELSDYGFDSVSFTELSKRINDKFRLEVSPARFFGYSTLNKVVAGLYEENSEVLDTFYNISKGEGKEPALHGKTGKHSGAMAAGASSPAALKSSPAYAGGVRQNVRQDAFRRKQDPVAAAPAYEPVAIIGMSGIMPQSEDLVEFWRNIEAERALITEIPKDRWNWEKIYGDPGNGEFKANVKWGGFMKEIDRFDASFFSIPPVEAELMDPQERLVLQTAWKAVEDAGYKISDLSGTDTGVFVGVSNTDYKDLLIQMGVPEVMPSQSFVANRISYTFNLRGPSEPVDSACSSAIGAIHRAVKAIQDGECAMALAGAINVIASPSLYVLDCKLGLLSPDGRCKSFDKKADGYVRGEGVGVLLLKSLKQAIADGDNIHAVVRGTAVQHGGRGTSINAPNADAQADVIFNAVEKSGIDPSTISYIDAHGTGTLLGDAAEIDGLKKAFKKLYKKWGKAETGKPHIGIGSVKTNVGHLESAAGIAGVFKVVLAMKNKKLPASLGFEELNPYVKLDGSPFYIADRTSEWMPVLDDSSGRLPRRAGVSSFGAGGTNAHVVIEEYRASASYAAQIEQTPRLMVLSAKNEVQLKEYAKKLAEYIGGIDNSTGSSADRDGELLGCLKTELASILSGILGVAAGEIDMETDVKECGLDLVGLSEFIERIGDRLGLQLGSTVLVENNTLVSLAHYLFKEHKETVSGLFAKGAKEGSPETGKGVSIAEIEYTLQRGREEMPERLAVIASGTEDLKNKLLMFYQGESQTENIFTGNTRSPKEDTMQLLEEEDGKEYIAALIRKRKLTQIARLWVKGVSIDWKLLNHASVTKRVPLPSYPFARERHWLPGTNLDWTPEETATVKTRKRKEQNEVLLPGGEAQDKLMELLRKVESGALTAQQALEKENF